MKTIGVVPARMAASRFPGKPLHPICGRPMLEHCFLRARLFDGWDGLYLATCDEEIRDFAQPKDFPVIMTSPTHTRALDRVAEAVEKCPETITDTDIVVCVQADEPLLGPDVIEAVIKPFTEDDGVEGTMLAVPIVDEETFLNPDIVKIVHDMKGDVLYTSRAPVPYCEKFSPELGAKRVGGVFGFRWRFLKWFTATPESPLEIKESCDSNRICDNGFRQRIAAIPYRPYLSVDSPEDVARVEAVIKDDPLWGKY
ncbi:MAG TPA: 3-deoxy-manno-octulosonate cytidylyltransferase [Rhodospirillales bacterium]|nr:3-deoxy-manno-octulosonate cytidylyltransferase [Rhodospirillales bacterium]